jgi:tRNA(Ile)-lysidine synthase TilS/MesJ
MRYYVLTSRNLKCLKRHFHSLPKEHTTVVINTTLDWYEEQASQYCKENKINYVLTESNGYPGRGKNSVLQHFLSTDEEYMVQIDGDDFMQPHGVNLYKAVAESDNPPDGIQIMHSISWTGGRKLWDDLWIRNPWTENFLKLKDHQVKKFPHLKEALEHIFQNRKEVNAVYRQHCKDNKKWNYPPDSRHPMDCARLIFWSRKLAELVTFREDLMIGEDSLVNYQVRDLAYKGEITLQKVNDEEQHTYVYDQTNSGIVRRLQNKLDWTWVQPLNDAIAEESRNWTVTEEFSIDPVAIEIEKARELNLRKL